MTGIFVTGTDTGVGKTTISIELMEFLKSKGFKVAGIKPVSAGCRLENGNWVNDDALQLIKHSSITLSYAEANPYALIQASAPEIAAMNQGVNIDLKKIVNQCRELEKKTEILIVEGIGGWEVPLTEDQRMSELVEELCFPVILTVGLRLGCLNHAILTEQAINQKMINLLGWVANEVDPNFKQPTEVVNSLMRQLQSPFLGMMPFKNRIKLAGKKWGWNTGLFSSFPEEFLLRHSI